MNFYLAPLEGITTYIYRNAIHDFYGEAIDKYFIPFIEPHKKRAFNTRELREILPEHNAGRNVVPQILTKSAEDFLFLEKALLDFGYQEINLNLGCPSGTVVGKGRGAAILSDLPTLEALLDGIFSGTNARISVKTRIGMESVEEFASILEIYNRFPISELIIHPRVQKEYYNGTPHYDSFQYAMEQSRIPLCYSGDIFSLTAYQKLCAQLALPASDRNCVMIGRGILQNPELISILSSGAEKKIDLQKRKDFHDRLLSDYLEELKDEKNTLFKMKELWTFWGMQFAEPKKILKELNKAQDLYSYRLAAGKLLSCDY